MFQKSFTGIICILELWKFFEKTGKIKNRPSKTRFSKPTLLQRFWGRTSWFVVEQWPRHIKAKLDNLYIWYLWFFSDLNSFSPSSLISLQKPWKYYSDTFFCFLFFLTENVTYNCSAILWHQWLFLFLRVTQVYLELWNSGHSFTFNHWIWKNRKQIGSP